MAGQPIQPIRGEFELYRPADWFDLLEEGPRGPEADAAAERRFAELITGTFSKADGATRDAAVASLLAWRAGMLDAGLVSHGVVNCPRDLEADPDEAARRVVESGDMSAWTTWHVLTAAVDVPSAPAELDLGEFFARVLGRETDPDACYVESFDTEMGCGFGLIAQPTFPSAADAVSVLLLDPVALGVDAPSTGPVQYGLAAALTTSPGGGPGLLVTGMCVDPEQVLEVAGLVALIAGNSRVRN